VQLALLTLLVALGGPVTAQIPPNATPEEVKKIKDDATAQKEAYEALTSAENAKKAWAAAQDASRQALADQSAAAKAAKDLADAQKAQADAEKAQADAAAAAGKAKFGDIPASGYSGTADMGAGAGNAEAMLLGSVAVRQIASKFAASLKQDKPAGVATLLLFTATTVPDFQALVAFNAQFEGIEFAFDQTTAATKGVDIAPVGLATFSVAAVGLGLDALNKVLGFFKSDYKFQGIAVDSTDGMLLTALAQELRKQGVPCEIPAVYQPRALDGAGTTLEKFNKLSARGSQAREKARLHELAQTQLEAEQAAKLKDKKDAEAAALQPRIQKAKEAAAIWKALADRIDAWAKQVAVADDKGNVPMVTILRQAALKAALDDSAALVVVQLHKVAGTGYTVKNIWSSLGANPFHVAGGAVASVMAFDGKSGQVFSSALLPWHGG